MYIFNFWIHFSNYCVKNFLLTLIESCTSLCNKISLWTYCFWIIWHKSEKDCNLRKMADSARKSWSPWLPTKPISTQNFDAMVIIYHARYKWFRRIFDWLYWDLLRGRKNVSPQHDVMPIQGYFWNSFRFEIILST